MMILFKIASEITEKIICSVFTVSDIILPSLSCGEAISALQTRIYF